VTIKLAGKTAALNALGKYLGLFHDTGGAQARNVPRSVQSFSPLTHSRSNLTACAD
jgi:hypothetical protein